jgi:hypothetical protein
MKENPAMAWSVKMRATSAAIVVYIALTEFLLAAVPLGAILWLTHTVSARHLLAFGMAGAIVWGSIIVALANVKTLSTPPRATGDIR